MLEKDIVATIMRYLKGLTQCFCWKTHGGQFGTAGIPDIIACIGGQFYAFEVKTPTGKATKLQREKLRSNLSLGIDKENHRIRRRRSHSAKRRRGKKYNYGGRKMKYTCFAYKKGECRALNECICDNGECRFYKTDAERAAGLRKAEERIRSLDPDIVRHITATYKSRL